MIDNEFEEKLKEIFFNVVQYGITKELSLNKQPEDFNYERFITFCNEGFKIGQQLALEELRKLEKERNEIVALIKEYRVKKNVEEKKKADVKLKINEYKSELIRNLIYTIAWQIYGGKREILARFYTDERGNNQLEGEGFQAILNAADEINKDPNKFALISDLTNNIQIGDLIVITSKGIEVIEVKTGKMNEDARRLIDFYELNDIEITEERLSRNLDQKFAKQIVRMKKQDVKSERLKKIVEEDKGEHPKYEDTRVYLIDNSISDEVFHKEIGKLLEQLKEEDWAYTNIWGVVNVGVYKNQSRSNGKFILGFLNKGFPVHDATSLGVNISEPIFAKPLYWGGQNIIDIALGRIKIYIGIDFDEFIRFANDLGLPLRWSSKKELSKMLSALKGINTKEIFSFNNKGLIIEDEETKGNPMFVGQGMLARIIYDQVSPLTLVKNRILGFQQFKEELKKGKASNK